MLIEVEETLGNVGAGDRGQHLAGGWYDGMAKKEGEERTNEMSSFGDASLGPTIALLSSVHHDRVSHNERDLRYRRG